MIYSRVKINLDVWDFDFSWTSILVPCYHPLLVVPTNRDETVWLVSQLPPFSCCWADQSELIKGCFPLNVVGVLVLHNSWCTSTVLYYYAALDCYYTVQSSLKSHGTFSSAIVLVFVCCSGRMPGACMVWRMKERTREDKNPVDELVW